MPESAAVDAPPVQRTPRGLRTRARILDAAEELFAERGFEATPLRDVAERVGLRIPSLYNHFDSKESLYAAVLERGIGPVFEILAGFVVDGSADSTQIVRRMMDLLAQRPNLARLVQHETLAGGRRLTPMLERWLAPTFGRAQEIVESSAAARRFRPEQIPLLVLAMYQIVVGYFTTAPLYEQLQGEDPMSAPALARQTEFLCELSARLFNAEE